MIYREFAFGLIGAMMAPHGQNPGSCSTSITSSDDDFSFALGEGKPEALWLSFLVI
jgi:hypothetical protein